MKIIITRIYHDKIFWITLGFTLFSLLLGLPRLSDLNWHTIFSLFALMICVQLLNSLQLLDKLSRLLVAFSSNSRQTIQFLVILSFISSMLLTNDVAILTLIPLFISIAHEQRLKTAFPATMIIVAANLGSAFTPFGNPQNLFLISNYHLRSGQFFRISFPFMIISLLLLIPLTWLIRAKVIKKISKESITIKKIPLVMTGCLLLIVFLGIFNFISIQLVGVIAIISCFFIDKQVIKKIDYGLLLTILCFFVMVSDFSHSTLINHLISQLTQTKSMVYITSLLLSQFISNVPATLLLAHFTNKIRALFWGVNVGSLGTLIASLANLLALKQLILFDQTSHIYQFIKIFTLVNVILLILLGILGLIFI
ncbi:MAG: SLC13 family permease [Liquorilactobacillus sp.]|uniref:SLC13 family permease n=1 Tax=Liquorilactobacillus sp. TaxID=2767923 RepID=UPI0039E7B35F